MEYENHHKVTVEHLQLRPRFYASPDASLLISHHKTDLPHGSSIANSVLHVLSKRNSQLVPIKAKCGYTPSATHQHEAIGSD
jgi:hypothetical protein